MDKFNNNYNAKLLEEIDNYNDLRQATHFAVLCNDWTGKGDPLHGERLIVLIISKKLAPRFMDSNWRFRISAKDVKRFKLNPSRYGVAIGPTVMKSTIEKWGDNLGKGFDCWWRWYNGDDRYDLNTVTPGSYKDNVDCVMWNGIGTEAKSCAVGAGHLLEHKNPANKKAKK